MIAGGYNCAKGGGEKSLTSVEVISSFSRANIALPNLPREITKDKISTDCSMFVHDGTLMVFGSTSDLSYHDKGPWKCFQFNNGAWKEHSTLKRRRSYSATVTTDKGTFIFGGNGNSKSYEYLPNGSDKWKNGRQRQLPNGFYFGCAIEVKSKQEIWLIGGNLDRIRSFNIDSHTTQELPFKLIKKRHHFSSAFIPETSKILVTGGISGIEHEKTCEIIDTEDGIVTMASQMNAKRIGHGMGVFTIKGEDKLAVFGGFDGKTRLDSVEIYNTQSKQWETTDIKLKKPLNIFGFLSVKLSDIISEF